MTAAAADDMSMASAMLLRLTGPAISCRASAVMGRFRHRCGEVVFHPAEDCPSKVLVYRLLLMAECRLLLVLLSTCRSII